jgi:hypothetical protein
MWEDENQSSSGGPSSIWDSSPSPSDATSGFSLADEGRNVWNGVTGVVGKVRDTVTPWIDGAVHTVSNGAKELWSGIAD